MAFVVLSTKAKNDAWGFQTANNVKTDLDYLKTQSEVLVVQDGTAIKADVVPESALKMPNAPVEGQILVARAAETGGLCWDGLYEIEDFWAFQ